MMSSRYSLGGLVVTSSLAAAGYDVRTPNVGLVETVDPRGKVRAVLAQSAWNVMPWPEFVAMQRRYPLKMQATALARRRLAHVNLRRADKVVCLTHAMADMTQQFAKRDVYRTPVSLPLDAVALHSRRAPEKASVAVVPGTVTWYKRPWAALEWVSNHPDVKIDRVLYLGRDDGSGCRAWLEKRAGELGLTCEFDLLDRPGLYSTLAEATVVVLPSALESLGFALAEALWVAEYVVASPIPAHQEIASRLGAEPIWIDSDRRTSRPPGMAAERALVEWSTVGRELGLNQR